MEIQEAASPGTNQGSPMSRNHVGWGEETCDVADLVEDMNWPDELEMGQDMNIAVRNVRNRLMNRLQPKIYQGPPPPTQGKFFLFSSVGWV